MQEQNQEQEIEKERILMQERLQEFIHLVMEGKSFTWRLGNEDVQMFLLPAGKASVIYREYPPEQNFKKTIKDRFQSYWYFTAILADGICYMDNIWGIYPYSRLADDVMRSGITLPKGFKWTGDGRRKLEEFYNNEFLKEFMESIEPYEHPGRGISDDARNDARLELLKSDEISPSGRFMCVKPMYNPNISITTEEFKKSLCGIFDTKEYAMKHLRAYEYECRNLKTYRELLKKELNEGAGIQPWEYRMNDAVKKLYGIRQGYIASKEGFNCTDDIAAEVVFDILSDCHKVKIWSWGLAEVFYQEGKTFSYSDFEDGAKGQELCDMVYSARQGKMLTMDDIVSISFNDEVLFERQPDERQ